MEPASTDPYQPPREPSLPPEPPAKKPGGRVPIAVAAILLVLVGFTTPSATFGLVSLTFAVAGIAMASNTEQRIAGIAVSASSLLVIIFFWEF